MEKQKIQVTPEYKQCIKFLKRGEKFVFVSGKAGVGKSVLIKFLQNKLRNKNMILVAPTGIASINIGGQTIHSLFGFNTDIITPYNVKIGNGGMKEVFKKIDILVIDEISMVRADIMDGIDISLRRHRSSNEPFGGVQIVVVGDLFQLPPVVRTEEEKRFFAKHYKTEFFFSALVFQKIDFLSILLEKVFRQKDDKTVEVLNKIRINEDHRDAVAYVNRNCYGINQEYAHIERDITLTTVNYKAEQINNNKLRMLSNQQYTYTATIEGKFNTKMPTPEVLHLKVGAKVMFTKNSEEWVNGTLGEVVSLTKTLIKIKINNNNKIVEVPKAIWENKKYQLDPYGEDLDSVLIGSFTQYPLTLAWAITIHKSQGLTLDNMRIDLDKGAFAAGQAYVALSRCKDLSSVSLTRPIRMSDVKLDKRVVDFYKSLEETFEEVDEEKED
jgi:ATP-dependent exoDNAse (exonuclease V) alpha subunit